MNYRWVDLPCNCCDSAEFVELGFRGGQAHTAHKGTTCKIVKCLRCGHIYPKPMPIMENTDTAYKGVDNYFMHHNQDQRVKRYAFILSKLQAKYGQKMRLLDVGTGRGEMLYAARTLGIEAEGIEPSVEFARFVQKTYGAKIKNCPLEKAGYPEDYFDLVTLSGVLEHLCYPKKELMEINRILKPNGLLWIDSPNEASLYHLIANLYFRLQKKNWVAHLSPTFQPYHIQGFTKKSIRTILANAGFRIEELRIYAGRALLPHQRLKECLEYLGTWVVLKVADTFRMGTFMEIIARKT